MEQDSERKIKPRGIKILVVGSVASGLTELLALCGDSPDPVVFVSAEVAQQVNDLNKAAKEAAEEFKDFAELVLTKCDPPIDYLDDERPERVRVNKAPFKGQANKYNSKQINRPRLRVQQHR